jgi:hypothetical protein
VSEEEEEDEDEGDEEAAMNAMMGISGRTYGDGRGGNEASGRFQPLGKPMGVSVMSQEEEEEEYENM